MDKLHLEIITQEKIVFAQEVEMVVVPGVEGDLGIMPHHIPLFTKIKPGEIKIINGKETEYLAITGGFLDVTGEGKVTILADYAIRSADIELAKAEEAKKKAEEAMKEKTAKVDFALAENELKRAILELKVARRKKV